MIDKIVIYTDGGYSIAKGVGGWACIVTKNEEELEAYRQFGSLHNQTSNRMELYAFIQGLKYSLTFSENSEILTDSNYVVRGFNEWIENWKNNNWKNTAKKDIKNRDLWEKVWKLRHPNVKVKWVKGHNGNKFNEIVDSLTRDYQ